MVDLTIEGAVARAQSMAEGRAARLRGAGSPYRMGDRILAPTCEVYRDRELVAAVVAPVADGDTFADIVRVACAGFLADTAVVVNDQFVRRLDDPAELDTYVDGSAAQAWADGNPGAKVSNALTVLVATPLRTELTLLPYTVTAAGNLLWADPQTITDGLEGRKVASVRDGFSAATQARDALIEAAQERYPVSGSRALRQAAADAVLVDAIRSMHAFVAYEPPSKAAGEWFDTHVPWGCNDAVSGRDLDAELGDDT